MKAVILAGGLGTRISEESILKPKPMIEIGGMPILWHIMKIYSTYGVYDFIICCGYRGYIIKEFFSNYFLHMSDVTIDLSENKIEIHNGRAEPWRITLVDTGENTMTGGRILRIKKFVENERMFCLTYGDGLCDINLIKLFDFHKNNNKICTVTAIKPPGRFGALEIDSNNQVLSFLEKPEGDGGMINGGFFVLSPEIFQFIKDDETVWEKEPLEKLASSNNLLAFKHDGFWQAMDTLRDKNLLESLWNSGKAPWKIW
jgi:glucose-1-phosphate cytidylyltransferase